MIEFEWDSAKAQANLRKHGVWFEEAESVFNDEYARQFFDDGHFGSEDHFIMLGLCDRSRVLVVCHCERSRGNVVRVISARKATSRERKYYNGPTP